MNRIISILLSVILVQLLILLYIQFVYEKPVAIVNINNSTALHTYEDRELEVLVDSSIAEIMQKAKMLPQSQEYTIWDKQALQEVHQVLLAKKRTQLPKILKKEPPLKIATHISHKKEFEKINRLKKEIRILVEGSLHQTNMKSIKTSSHPTKITTVKKCIKKVPKQLSILQKVEKYAKAKLGNKYVWGATGPNKFDCSGFTREVFKSTLGISIPRVSREQAKVGKFIEFKDLQRGDMVFFDTEKKFTKRVNHVGIYLSNGNFIHASSAKKKVIITSFRKKPFYKRRFLWGRRVVKNKS